MHTFLRPCQAFHFRVSSPSSFPVVLWELQDRRLTSSNSCRLFGSTKRLSLSINSAFLKSPYVLFAFKDDSDSAVDLSTDVSKRLRDSRALENDELGLLEKPSPLCFNSISAIDEVTDAKIPEKDEVLEPFLKLLKPTNGIESAEAEKGNYDIVKEICEVDGDKLDSGKVVVDYYEPKPGDFVIGVVVSGNENKLDVNVGANMLGTMLTKEVLPLYDKEMDNLLYDMEKQAINSLVSGRMGILRNEMAFTSVPGQGKPLVDIGSVLFAEVLGRTLSGRPLLSTRRLFRRVAWHRVRQLKEMNEPFEVHITEWNTGGLLARVEGLRAFLPKAELITKVSNFNELKENVGRRICVMINRINESNNDLILSEREAWEMINLQEGTLLEGTVKRIFAYGAQIRIEDTNRSGLLHISRISKNRISSVQDVLKVDETVKVLVVKSMFPDKISLSLADLEREPGLFLSNRERFLADAEEMAKIYRQNLKPIEPAEVASFRPSNGLCPGDDSMYANRKWFKFKGPEDATLPPIPHPFVC